MTTKKCNMCQEELPATEEYFQKDSAGKFGLKPRCRKCTKKWYAAKYKENKLNANTDTTITKACTKCGRILPATLEHFHAGTSKYGLMAWCRNCQNDSITVNQKAGKRKTYYRQWDAKNRQSIQAKQRVYRGKNRSAQRIRTNISVQRYKTRKYNLPVAFTSHDWKHALKYFNNMCVVCNSYGSLTADHWIALNDPECPGTVMTNMIPLCSSCNSSKSDRDVFDWLLAKYGRIRALVIIQRVETYFKTLKK